MLVQKRIREGRDNQGTVLCAVWVQKDLAVVWCSVFAADYCEILVDFLTGRLSVVKLL